MHLFLHLQETASFFLKGVLDSSSYLKFLRESNGLRTLNLKACIYWVFELTGMKNSIEILCQVVETGELMHTNLQPKLLNIISID